MGIQKIGKPGGGVSAFKFDPALDYYDITVKTINKSTDTTLFRSSGATDAPYWLNDPYIEMLLKSVWEKKDSSEGFETSVRAWVDVTGEPTEYIIDKSLILNDSCDAQKISGSALRLYDLGGIKIPYLKVGGTATPGLCGGAGNPCVNNHSCRIKVPKGTLEINPDFVYQSSTEYNITKLN